MRIQRSGEPLSDPFFATVRRRHPDVDLVMLPPEAPEPEPEPADLVSDEVVSVLGEQVADLMVRLWEMAGVPLPALPRVTLRHGGREAEVVVLARAGRVHQDEAEAFDRLRGELARHGWEVHETPAGLRRLVAARDDLDVVATYAEATGALVLTASARPVLVGLDRARALVRGGGR